MILIVATFSATKGIGGKEISGIVASIAGVVGAYVIGQGYADGQAVKNNKKIKE